MPAEQPPRPLWSSPTPRDQASDSLARVDTLLGRLRPLEDTAMLEARVLQRINAAGRSPTPTVRRTTGVWFGVGIAALAATAVGAWLASGSADNEERIGPRRPEVGASLPAARAGANAENGEQEPSAADAAPNALAPLVAPSARESVETRPAATPSHDAPRTDVKRTSTKAEASASAPAESLLYAAATALRRDRDPSRALELLRELRKEAPSLGAREDVRALEVEAHHRLGSTRTRALAEAYLRDFPSGRFRATALNVLGGSRGGK